MKPGMFCPAVTPYIAYPAMHRPIVRWSAPMLILASGLALMAGCAPLQDDPIIQDDTVEQSITNLCQGPPSHAPLRLYRAA